MKKTIISNAIITTSKSELRNHLLVINGDRIEDIFEDGSASVAEDAVVIDAKGYRLTPGLIDTHVSGAMGADCRQGADAT